MSSGCFPSKTSASAMQLFHHGSSSRATLFRSLKSSPTTFGRKKRLSLVSRRCSRTASTISAGSSRSCDQTNIDVAAGVILSTGEAPVQPHSGNATAKLYAAGLNPFEDILKPSLSAPKSWPIESPKGCSELNRNRRAPSVPSSTTRPCCRRLFSAFRVLFLTNPLLSASCVAEMCLPCRQSSLSRRTFDSAPKIAFSRYRIVHSARKAPAV